MRTTVVEAFAELGRAREEAAALWHAATTDVGPAGESARRAIQVVTDIHIYIEAGASDEASSFPR